LATPAFLELPFVVFLANLISTFAIGFMRVWNLSRKAVSHLCGVLLNRYWLNVVFLFRLVASGIFAILASILALCLPGLAGSTI
jgi:hypothetical protein